MSTLPVLRGSSRDPISLAAMKAYAEGQPLPTLRQIEQMHVLDQVCYPGLKFQVSLEEGRLFLRVVGSVPDWAARRDDLDQDRMRRQAGRKWRLSTHMTDGELVQTAFLAVAQWEEHERRERFTFLDAAVFDPYYDIYKLVDLREAADALKERP